MRIPIDTVLLVVDVQHAIDDPCWGPRNNPDAEGNIAALIATWREAGMPLVHVRHDSVEPRSPYRPGAPGHGFKPQAEPQPGERVVAKSTGSAFAGTGLEELLAEGGHTTLVVCGALTHNSVETTVRHAGCLGFRVFVPEDACWAAARVDRAGRQWSAEEVHALSLANLHGEYATVVDTRAAMLAALVIASRRRPARSA
ncbi:cysteine hydrolase [Alsobacter sp. SYSU M60028]|uniref:Cysteine hydrolase n=1 Tax=Alsobacter ponti TaxID=2962936 RepID=A0ABT1LI29_9HYPH|nr:cysteine hydrolase family protein [Alsobacter ponti]MCP8940538.1 cysteine hydrolase [Alsobacter ponti]